MATDHATQARFAALIGVATPTIQSIENGRLPLSERLALRIERATGADHRELLKGSAGKARTITGEPFSATFFQNWRDSQNTRVSSPTPAADTGTESIAAAVSRELGFWTRTLVAASTPAPEDPQSNTVAPRLTAVRFAVAEALEKICADLRLSNRIESLLRPLREVEYCSGSLNDWSETAARETNRAEISPLETIRRCVKFHPDAKLTVSLEAVPRWSPSESVPRFGSGDGTIGDIA